MATNTLQPGAALANAPPQLPDLEGLDLASCILDPLNGAAGTLAETLSKQGEALDVVHAAYALGHLATYASDTVEAVHRALLGAQS